MLAERLDIRMPDFCVTLHAFDERDELGEVAGESNSSGRLYVRKIREGVFW